LPPNCVFKIALEAGSPHALVLCKKWLETLSWPKFFTALLVERKGVTGALLHCLKRMKARHLELILDGDREAHASMLRATHEAYETANTHRDSRLDLVLAATYDCSNDMVRVLLGADSGRLDDLVTLDGKTVTPVSAAAKAGNLAALARLVDAGATGEPTALWGDAICHTVANGNMHVLRALLRSGAMLSRRGWGRGSMRASHEP